MECLRPRIFKNTALLMLLAILSACSLGLGQTSLVSVYDFGIRSTSDVKKQNLKMSLEMRAPAWLDSPAIYYRLNDLDPLQLMKYTESRWAMSPATLLSYDMQQTLGIAASGVTRDQRCSLRVELQDFSQIFDNQTQSRGRLHASVLVLNQEGRVLAQEVFILYKPADTPDARGGVRALASVAHDFSSEVSAWISTKIKDDLAHCVLQ